MITKLSMVRGDSFTRTIIFSREDGSAYNITGWTITFTLKQNWQLPDSQSSLQKIITSHTDPVNGKTVLQLLPEDTRNLDPRDYDFDIQSLANTGTSGTAGTASEIYTVLRGKMTLEYDVTIGTAGTAGT
jgi:1-aminocyclopropane-1-carboxylate deaminase/D-cysteine desulfhydrase-like pyridoxal-dependent ACC family enzyme